MNTEKLFKIVIMDLSSDITKLEYDLELVINSTQDTDTKVKSIKSILAKIVETESSIIKFTSMITQNNTEGKDTEGNG